MYSACENLLYLIVKLLSLGKKKQRNTIEILFLQKQVNQRFGPCFWVGGLNFEINFQKLTLPLHFGSYYRQHIFFSALQPYLSLCVLSTLVAYRITLI
jgi:hypothetical protein